MTQHYFGCKQILAYEQEKDGKPGYGVRYPDGYTSWSPKDVFESAYLPMGETPNGDGTFAVNENRVTQKMVDEFIQKVEVKTLGEKTTVVQATLRNGFEIVESSSCVEASNYSEELGAKICLERIKNQVWHLLGFALQWARSGLK